MTDKIPKLSNLNNATAADLKWLLVHRCKHHKRYLEHFSCFLKEAHVEERLGYLDIESNGLIADFGVMLSYCILDGDTGKILGRHITRKEILSAGFDKTLVADCIKDMRKFDRLIAHYGIGPKKFDIPYLRTKAIHYGLDFPKPGEIYGTDTHPISKNKLRLSSNRLLTVATALLGKTEKTRVDGNLWLRAVQGDSKALAEIFDHNKRDVRDLKRIFEKVRPYVNLTKTSI
jgi:uncharacterized protein YprB with RNaseH-like and TPR domain